MTEAPLPLRDQMSLALKDVWVLHEEKIRSQLREMMKVRPRDTEEDIQKNLEKLVEKERAFLNHVVVVIEQATQDPSYTEQLILFDIDETIARNRFLDDSGSNRVTLLRPAFMALLPALAPRIQDGTLEIGILSTRSQEGLETQLEDPNHLQAIAEYMSSAHVYSSRNTTHDITFDTLKDVAILDMSKINEFNGLVAAINSGDYDKIAKLQTIKTANPDKAIVVVDDFVFPALLDEKKGLYGCRVESDEVFAI